ncbi:hypothetical protein IWX90DRAFT_131165 [Phyllosticta citrichinensis]|uniref:Uncharacterized protein n=1 Tax=Phyllosticta citrichinensis TaxID=1130410 RepID=A0ABR1Y4H9_9PEZI
MRMRAGRLPAAPASLVRTPQRLNSATLLANQPRPQFNFIADPPYTAFPYIPISAPLCPSSARPRHRRPPDPRHPPRLSSQNGSAQRRAPRTASSRPLPPQPTHARVASPSWPGAPSSAPPPSNCRAPPANSHCAASDSESTDLDKTAPGRRTTPL